MAKKDDFIKCPKCNKQISSYALLCPHCHVRIIQKDFGKAERESISKEAVYFESRHHIAHGWTNTVMLLLIFTGALGVIFRFQEKIFGKFLQDPSYHISLTRAEFEKICRDGIAETMYSEHSDAEKMGMALEAYAKLHGYPNKAALLKTCAKATYEHVNGKQE